MKKQRTFEYVWTTHDEEQSRNLLTYRMSLQRNHLVRLTDSTVWRVVDNFPAQNCVLGVRPKVGQRYYFGTEKEYIPYLVIVKEGTGYKVRYEDFLESEGRDFIQYYLDQENYSAARQYIKNCEALGINVADLKKECKQ